MGPGRAHRKRGFDLVNWPGELEFFDGSAPETALRNKVTLVADYVTEDG
jgi:hypothetical protein